MISPDLRMGGQGRVRRLRKSPIRVELATRKEPMSHEAAALPLAPLRTDHQNYARYARVEITHRRAGFILAAFFKMESEKATAFFSPIGCYFVWSACASCQGLEKVTGSSLLSIWTSGAIPFAFPSSSSKHRTPRQTPLNTHTLIHTHICRRWKKRNILQNRFTSIHCSIPTQHNYV